MLVALHEITSRTSNASFIEQSATIEFFFIPKETSVVVDVGGSPEHVEMSTCMPQRSGNLSANLEIYGLL